MRHLIYILTLLFLTNCGQQKSDQTNITSIDTTRTNISNPDTTQLKESFNEDDLQVNEFLVERLKPIRENFKKINSITSWTSIDSAELFGSTEGGQGKYYYQGRQLQKIIARHYGESFQLLTEYYLLNGQLSFVFEKRHKYNRPLYYDTTAMKENNDTEAFSLDKSEIIEDRSYFEDGKLIHQINNQDCGSPFTTDYLLEEQKRLTLGFDDVIKQLDDKPNR